MTREPPAGRRFRDIIAVLKSSEHYTHTNRTMMQGAPFLMSRGGSNIIPVGAAYRASARGARSNDAARSNASSRRYAQRSYGSAFGISSHAVGESSSSVRGLDYSQSLDPFEGDSFARKERSRFSRVTRSGSIEPLDAGAFDGDKQASFAARSKVSTRPARSSRSSASPARASGINLTAFSAFDDLDEQLFGSKDARIARGASDRGSKSASVRAAVEVFDPDDAEDEDNRSLVSGRRSKRDRRDKSKAKAKAEKMFNRQFGSDAPSGAEAGSRAAVYKGEMGHNHKRAFADLGGFSEKRGDSSRRAHREKQEKARRGAPVVVYVAGALICIAVAVLFLYPTAQQFYIEVRTQDKLQAEYSQIAERNAAIQSDIDRLSTDEGIQDAAREQLGWVVAGETAGVVSGLDGEGSSESSNAVYAQVDADSVKTPETWYSSVLDPIFGYSDN